MKPADTGRRWGAGMGGECATLEVDTERAEALLYDLASKLVRVPLGPRTREVHLRALTLKREVARWRDAPPAEAARRATLDELVALQHQAGESTRHPSGRVLVRGGRAYKAAAG